MGVFLPSETARLVLGYLLDNDFSKSRDIFMSECLPLAELKSIPESKLKIACKVHHRSLTEVLKEYSRYLL